LYDIHSFLQRQENTAMTNLQSYRREYGKLNLLEKDIPSDPYELFDHWLDEAIEREISDATAMVLATVDLQGYPDTRVVLLKEFDSQGFIFFTHYNSPKGIQMHANTTVALNFYWRQLARQVRIRGKISQVTREESETYFATRPRASQICTLASTQSAVVASREAIEKHVRELTAELEGKEVPCPQHWGGYRVNPGEFEFFQGRDDRLNDRIRFQQAGEQWKIERLSP
jgi:pyridoxamine 5'-phosphate oxidase